MARTLVIGDSLGVGTLPYLKKLLGPIAADVVGGRSSASGIAALKSKLAGGNYSRIVLDLGTNDTTAGQLAKSIRIARKLAPGAQIYVPTLNGPYQTPQKNQMLRRLAGGNVHLIDWRGASAGQLASDGIHASSSGYQKRARLIAKALGQAGAPAPVQAAVAGGGLGNPAMASAVSAYLANPNDFGALYGLSQAMGARRG